MSEHHYFFMCIIPPAPLPPEERAELLAMLERQRQFQCAEGDSADPANKICSTWPFIVDTNSSYRGLSGRNHAPHAVTQFSTVTGTPATKQARTAFVANAMAAVVSIIWFTSLSVKAMARLRWCMRRLWNESGWPRKGGRP